MSYVNRYFTMGLREKVALTISVIIFMQVISVISGHKSKTLKSDSNKQNQKRSLGDATHPSTFKTVYPHVQGQKTKSRKAFDKGLEAVHKTFNFPDVEYPTASTPRPHFYLQETNIQQKNQIQRPVEDPLSTTTTTLYSVPASTKNLKYNKKKYNNLAKFNKNTGITKTFPEFGTTSKPYCYREEGVFPEVEYPLKASDTWKPNYWKQIPIYGAKNTVNNNEPNSYSKLNTNLKSKRRSPSKISIPTKTSAPNSKSVSKENSNNTNTTPASAQVSTTKSTNPLIFTPYNVDTTPSYIDMRIDENENTTPVPKKTTIKKNKKKKEKSPKKDTSLIEDNKKFSKDDACITKTSPYSFTSSLQDEVLHITKTQESLFTVMPYEPISDRNLNKLDTCSNILNITFSSVATTTPSHLSSDVSTSIFNTHNDVQMPTVYCDNKVTSISDAINTVVSENTDNKGSCFEDNVRNSNKPSASDADEEFTTDVFPDFDENVLSASTSTVSPMSLVGIDETWENSVVIDPYKSVTYPDELDLYYIALP